VVVFVVVVVVIDDDDDDDFNYPPVHLRYSVPLRK
jgi:hypothetical protein